jgi:TfoX/Sxy family transcriptional regulator of competence genes
MGSREDADSLTFRARAALAKELTTERRMFGGTSFMLNGNLLCWAGRNGLMLRVGRDGEAAALAQPFVGPCLETGRPMGGFVMISMPGVADDAALRKWLDVGRAHLAALPAKQGSQVRRKKRPRRSQLRA